MERTIISILSSRTLFGCIRDYILKKNNKPLENMMYSAFAYNIAMEYVTFFPE